MFIVIELIAISTAVREGQNKFNFINVIRLALSHTKSLLSSLTLAASQIDALNSSFLQNDSNRSNHSATSSPHALLMAAAVHSG